MHYKIDATDKTIIKAINVFSHLRYPVVIITQRFYRKICDEQLPFAIHYNKSLKKPVT